MAVMDLTPPGPRPVNLPGVLKKILENKLETSDILFIFYCIDEKNHLKAAASFEAKSSYTTIGLAAYGYLVIFSQSFIVWANLITSHRLSVRIKTY